MQLKADKNPAWPRQSAFRSVEYTVSYIDGVKQGPSCKAPRGFEEEEWEYWTKFFKGSSRVWKWYEASSCSIHWQHIPAMIFIWSWMSLLQCTSFSKRGRSSSILQLLHSSRVHLPQIGNDVARWMWSVVWFFLSDLIGTWECPSLLYYVCRHSLFLPAPIISLLLNSKRLRILGMQN